MSQETLRKLWLVLALICLVFAFASHARLQGGPFEFIFNPLIGVVFKEGTPHAIIAMWGIYLLGLIFLFANYVLTEHAKAEEGDWKDRYPFRLYDLSVGSNIGTKAQFIAFGLFTLAPLISLVRFWVVIVDQGILCIRPVGGGNHVQDLNAGPFGIPADWSLTRAFGDEYRLADFDGGKCNEATTWFPVLSPILLGLVTIACAWFLLRATRVLYRPINRNEV
jgi:hypothetical protein